MEENLSCDEVLDHLSAYMDGEVDLKLHYLITNHLQNCSKCLNEFTQLQNLSILVKTSFNSKQLEMEENTLSPVQIASLLKLKEECDYVSENLSAYFDGELSKKEMIKISEHLMQCKYCRRDYENLKETIKVTKKYFDQFEVPQNDLRVKAIVNKVNYSYRKFYAAATAAAVFCLSALTWFSINIIEPSIVKTMFKEQEIPLKNDVLYVKAEKYFMEAVNELPKIQLAMVFDEN